MIPMRLTLTAALCFVAWSTCVAAQTNSAQNAPQVLTLEEALQYALDHYPTVRAALEQVNASRANVSVAQSTSLPRLDALWQTNRATANNVFGQLLPQAIIPALSGPVLASASSEFSISSFTAEAGRSTTSPAAIRLARSSDKIWIFTVIL